MGIEAAVIEDSVSPDGIRLTTMQVTLHRFILAELNTHRMLSRNFRSSRAVPVRKLLDEVRTAPAEPVVWMKNRPGMQATEPMTPEEEGYAYQEWLRGANYAADTAERLAATGLHKAWANRVIEPYLFVHGVVTSTEWANFYARRRAADAQPEFKALADAMWRAQGDSVARVSVKPFDENDRNIAKDMELHDRLWRDNHPSPFEHQATPDRKVGEIVTLRLGDGEPREIARGDCWMEPEMHGNLFGWCQYRKSLPNESVRDR